MASSITPNTAKMTTKEKKMARKNLEKGRSAKRRQEAQTKSAGLKKTTPVVKSVSSTPVKDTTVAAALESDEPAQKTDDIYILISTMNETSSAEAIVGCSNSDSEPESDSYSCTSGSTTPSEVGCFEICSENSEPAGRMTNISIYGTCEEIALETSKTEGTSDTQSNDVLASSTMLPSKTLGPQFSKKPSTPVQVTKKKIAVSAFAKATDGGRKMSAKEIKAMRKKMDKGGGKARSKIYKLLESASKSSLDVGPVVDDAVKPSAEEPAAQSKVAVNQQHDPDQNIVLYHDIEQETVGTEEPHVQLNVVNHGAAQEDLIVTTPKNDKLMATISIEEITLMDKKIRELETIFPDLEKKVDLPFTARRRHSISCSNTNIAQEIINTMQTQKGSLQMGANLIDEFLDDVTAPSSPFLYHETDMPVRWEGMLMSESGVIDHEYRGPLQVYQRDGPFGAGQFSPVQGHHDVAPGLLAVTPLQLDHGARHNTDDARLNDELKNIQKTSAFQTTNDVRESILLDDPAIVAYKTLCPQVAAIDPIFHDPAVISCKSSPTQSPQLDTGDKAVLDDPSIIFAKSISLGMRKTSLTTPAESPAPSPISDFERLFHELQGSRQCSLFDGPGHTPLEIARYQNNIHEPAYWGMVPHPYLPCTYMYGSIGWGYYVLPTNFVQPPSAEYYWNGGFIDLPWCHESTLGVEAF